MKDERFDRESNLVTPISGRRDKTINVQPISTVIRSQEKTEPIPGAAEASTVPFTEIGFGRPLSLTIESIFPGSAGWHDRERIGGILVASAVKNPFLNDAAPTAMHYYFKDASAGEALLPSPHEGGSNVVYYSPGMIHSSLDVEVRMSFDRFDPAKLEVWTDAVGKVSNLPIFTAFPPTAGPAAIVYAASTAIKFAARAMDGWFDDDRDWISTWSPLPIAEEGFTSAKASWVLFYGDKEPETVQGVGGSIIAREFDYRGEQYVVDEESGTLRYRQNPEREVLEGAPYILARLSGQEKNQLKKWAPSAVSAVLYERFYGATSDGVASDLVEVVTAFNDMVMAKQVADLDVALKQLPAKDRKGSDLQKKRDGALKNIQDEKIADMLK
ncbi:hypothetical protein Achl_4448 (plasmid) [Pseudarthrobacter chlorophenolicus A6]|uniref:Uncharacterized protein n=2 Tax=Pseudarthrobacter chlorophenolicus TaxID=85085 RepID=B8HJ02_PSECP|nr:hypothetical protein Achl_4448 [Pseudarthrobacter chlorophenolicus A6]SDQ17603.1 hypothetical protein SAMN04489738_0505 [Pseudarthrobacter chlorophenolicus]